MAEEKETEEKPRTRPGGPGSMNDIFIRWDKLATNMRHYLPEMPHVATDHAELETLLARIRNSFSEQEIHTRRIAELIGGRKADMQAATELRNRLAANLQGRFGPSSERLLEFAIKPRKRRFRRKPKEETPPPPEPTTTIT